MADEADDLDYTGNNVGLAQAQGVRKNISLKLKGKGRGRGKRGGKVRKGSTKKVSGNDEEADEPAAEPEEVVSIVSAEKSATDSNLDDVISKLETPAFSPMDRSFPEPLHQNKKLRWDHKVNLIGEKVIDPLIHCCEKCTLPILNYGRMIPCKHVFCYDCAKKCDKLCPKCEEKVQRIEPSALGTVFMCTFGGSRLNPGSCGRTYLSQRDLQAHVNHRHLKPSSSTTPAATSSHATTTTTSSASSHTSRDPRDPRAHLQVDVSHQGLVVGHLQHPPDIREAVDHSRGSPAGQSRQYPHSPANYPSSIPVSSARPNLITVPIQDDGVSHSSGTSGHLHSQPHVPVYASSPVATPHPIQHPASGYAQPYPPHPTAVSAYSPAPPITTPTFSQPPPPVHHQPPLHQPGTSGGAPIYSAPPPLVPTGYTPPQGQAPPSRPPLHHHEGAPSYLPQWGAPTPPGRPITAPPPAGPNPNVRLLQPHGPPADPGFRQPYYQ